MLNANATLASTTRMRTGGAAPSQSTAQCVLARGRLLRFGPYFEEIPSGSDSIICLTEWLALEVTAPYGPMMKDETIKEF